MGETPSPPVVRKTGPHPPPGARTRPRLPMESRRSVHPGTQNRRGGGYPSLCMTGGYPSPTQKKEEGAPPHHSFERQAPTPPPVASTRAQFRMESRRKRYPVAGYFGRGVGAPHVPGGVPTPPTPKKEEGSPPSYAKEGTPSHVHGG